MNNVNSSPEGWVKKTLGEIADVIGGGTPSRKHPEFFGGDIVWLTPTEIPKNRITTISTSREMITKTGLQKSSARILPKNSVLFTSRASIGYVAIAGTEVTTNQGFASFICKEGVHNYFLAYWLLANAEFIKQHAKGTTFKEISKSKLLTFYISLPPLPEQERIVARIEELFTQLDAGMAALKRVQAGLKRYKASVLKAAFEGKLVYQESTDESATSYLKKLGIKPFDNYDYPHLPEGWEYIKLGSIAQVETGATPFRGNINFWQDGKIPWITSGAINNRKIFSAKEFITNEAVNNTNVKIFPAGSLVVAMYGEGRTRGKISELMIESATNQACAAIILSEKTDDLKQFLKFYFENNYIEIRRLASGGVQPNLNLSMIKNMLIPFPPINEQKRIVDEIERKLSIIEELELVVFSGLLKAENLRKSILHKAFIGALN